MQRLVLTAPASINLIVGVAHVCLPNSQAGATLAYGQLALIRAVKAAYDRAGYHTQIVPNR